MRTTTFTSGRPVGRSSESAAAFAVLMSLACCPTATGLSRFHSPGVRLCALHPNSRSPAGILGPRYPRRTFLNLPPWTIIKVLYASKACTLCIISTLPSIKSGPALNLQEDCFFFLGAEVEARAIMVCKTARRWPITTPRSILPPQRGSSGPFTNDLFSFADTAHVYVGQNRSLFGDCTLSGVTFHLRRKHFLQY